MRKGYRAYDPEQDLLLPPSLRQWLDDDHSGVLRQRGGGPVGSCRRSTQRTSRCRRRGQPPYDPRLMTKLLVYGYCTGVFSSRRIQKRLREDIPFKVLAAGNEPDFRTVSDFRKIHIETLQKLFEQVLAMALEVGAVKVGPCVAGRDEFESQREQTQGHELRPDDREATASEGRSEAVAGTGRGRR